MGPGRGGGGGTVNGHFLEKDSAPDLAPGLCVRCPESLSFTSPLVDPQVRPSAPSPSQPWTTGLGPWVPVGTDLHGDIPACQSNAAWVGLRAPDYPKPRR